MINHYQKLSENYTKFQKINENSLNLITDKIIKYLELNSDDIFADIGCGTGLFINEIHNKINFSNPSYCVDLSDKMLGKASDDKKIIKIAESAENFIKNDYKYNKILLKEVIHHIEKSEINFLNLQKRLNEKTIILLMHRVIEKNNNPFSEQLMKMDFNLENIFNQKVDFFKQLDLQIKKETVPIMNNMHNRVVAGYQTVANTPLTPPSLKLRLQTRFFPKKNRDRLYTAVH